MKKEKQTTKFNYSKNSLSEHPANLNGFGRSRKRFFAVNESLLYEHPVILNDFRRSRRCSDWRGFTVI